MGGRCGWSVVMMVVMVVLVVMIRFSLSKFFSQTMQA